MAGIYTIGTKKGYDLVQGMKPGSKVRGSDGSEWTMLDDGSISVLHNGNTLTGQVTYQPPATEVRKDGFAAMPGVGGYQSPYADRLNQIIAGLGQSKWEGWNEDTDPAFQAIRKQALREADRTAEDVLGQYAQNTGGIAGSSAITAASQAADYEKSKITDAIPGLINDNYARYLQGVAQQQDLAGLLINADQQGESQYYNRINAAMQKWAQQGYADQEIAKILGVAPGTATSDQAFAEWKQAFEEKNAADNLALQQYKATHSGRGGGGGGGGGRPSTEPPGKPGETPGAKPGQDGKGDQGETIDGMSWDDLDAWVYDRLQGMAGARHVDPHKIIDQQAGHLTEAQRKAAHEIVDAYLFSGFFKK